MNPVLNRNTFFVKEHVGAFKASNNYDIDDPESQQMIMQCREENLGFFTKLFRFTDYKRMTPFNIVIKDIQGNKILSVKRGTTLFVSKVNVYDENDKEIGSYKQHFFSFGGKFSLLNPAGETLCTLKGKWTSWDFKFIKEDTEFAFVSKKWAGLGKELFTTADNYMLGIDEKVPADHPLRVLILVAVMCIDMVLKE